MRTRVTGENHIPDPDFLNDVFDVLPREHHAEVVYDLTYQNGVLSGLFVQQQAVPNLTVRVTPGRASVRNDALRRATVADQASNVDLDLSSFVSPANSVTVTVYIVHELNAQVGAAIAISGAPEFLTDNSMHEDYDLDFVPYNLYTTKQDEADILATVGAVPAGGVILATVTLPAGATQVLAGMISYVARQRSGVAELINAITGRIEAIEPRVAALEALTQQHTDTLTEHDQRLESLEAWRTSLPMKPTKTLHVLANFPASGGGGALKASNPVVITEDFRGRTVHVDIAGVDALFFTGEVSLQIDLPGLPNIELGRKNNAGVSPSDQQKTFSGSYPWSVGNVPTLNANMTVKLVAISGVVDTGNAQSIGVSMHTIDNR